MTSATFLRPLRLSATVALSLSALSAWAAPPAPPPPPSGIARALAMPTASWLVGAAARERFAWVEQRAGVRNIWVADVGAPARALTSLTADDGQDLYDLAFDPGGNRLSYVRGGDAEFPDGPAPNPAHDAVAPQQRVHVRALADGSDRVLGTGHAPTFSPGGDRIAFTSGGALWLAPAMNGDAVEVATVPGGIANLSWSPDGTQILFQNDRGDHAAVVLFDVATGRLRYLDPALGFDVEPVFSPDGSRIAFIRFTDPPPAAAPDSGPYWSIRTVDLRSGAARSLWSPPSGKGARYAGTRGRNLFWGAGDTLVFPWERSGWIHVYALPASGGTPRPLTGGVFEVEGFLLDPAGRDLLYTANDGDIDRRHVGRRPVAGGPAVRMTGGTGIQVFPAFAGGRLAVIATDVTHPAFPALVAAAGVLTPLADRRADLSPAARYIAPEAVTFHADDGTLVHGQYYRAPGADIPPRRTTAADAARLPPLPLLFQRLHLQPGDGGKGL